MTTVVVILGVAATIAVVAWFVRPRNHPEDAATHGDSSTVTNPDQLHGGAGPAGPDAEAMDPERLGGDQHPPH